MLAFGAIFLRIIRLDFALERPWLTLMLPFKQSYFLILMLRKAATDTASFYELCAFFFRNVSDWSSVTTILSLFSTSRWLLWFPLLMAFIKCTPSWKYIVFIWIVSIYLYMCTVVPSSSSIFFRLLFGSMVSTYANSVVIEVGSSIQPLRNFYSIPLFTRYFRILI